jgi:transposase
VAAKLHTTGFTVGLWRNRFIADGVVGLGDEPRPGAPREIGDEKVDQVVRLTLEKTPKGATHCSSRMLAARTGLSQSTISRIWRAFGLKPHRTESFQLSADPLLIDKVRDIVGLYLDPPHHALVLCVDEKSQIQALSRTQLVQPMGAGQLERRTHDYKRHGVTSLFEALDIATGSVLGKCYRRHRSVEFLDFLRKIDGAVPADLDIHLVLDNYGTHETALVRHWLQKRPRYHLHFTPTHASWLNQVERWFALLTQRRLSAAHTEAFRNWKPQSRTSSLPTISNLNPFAGQKRQARYWHPSRASPPPLWRPTRRIFLQEINDSGD